MGDQRIVLIPAGAAEGVMAKLVSETNPFPVTVVGGGATGGTATGGSTSTLVDSVQSLVPNSYIGATLYITHGGATYPETVLSNTATTFVFAASTNTYGRGDTYGVVMPVPTVTSTDSGVLATGVTQPTGGVGLTGLLSGIWGWVSGQLSTLSPKVTASLSGSITAQAPGSPAPAQADMIGIEDINGKTQFVSKANPMITAPLNGNSRIATASISGTATSGTTGTLTDSTAAFPTANGGLAGQWATITRNTNGSGYPVLITSNTATQISFATLPNAVVVSDTYQILPAEVAIDTVRPVRHYVLPYTLFPGTTTGYYPYLGQILNPAAKRRSCLVVNNLNQAITGFQASSFDGMNGVIGDTTFGQTSFFGTIATISVGNSGTGSQNGTVADSIYFGLTTSATAPTSGQLDIYIREVL